jgi:hypothetical protein
MIGRISIPEGAPLAPNPDNFEIAMAELALNYFEDLAILVPGIYDVTPKLWTKNAQQHELEVLDNGEGLLQMRPKVAGAGVAILKGNEVSTPFRAGGRTTVVNESQPKTALAGGHPNRAGLHVFEVILYLSP